MKIGINSGTKCEIFVILFQQLKQFAEHINVMFDTNGLFIQGMDPSHIIIFELRLPSTWFSFYEVTESITIGINTIIISKVLNVHDKSQSMEISTGDKDVLTIQYLNSSNKLVFDKLLEVPLLDIEYDLMEIPEMEYQAEFSLDSSTFATLINQMKQFSDNMTITCSEEKIHLSSHSEEKGKMMTHIPIDDLHEFAIEEDKTLEMTFAIKYIYDVTTYQKICKQISICVSENSPIKMMYEIDENAHMVFFMAPRIDD